MAARRRETNRAPEPGRAPRSSFPLPVVLVTLFTSLGAAAALFALPAGVAWGGVLGVGVAGAALAALLSGGTHNDAGRETQLLLDAVEAGPDREVKLPRYASRAVRTLHEKVTALAQEARTGRAAVAELERFRRQVELATATYREGKDPLAEVAELRVGPLRDLLETAKEGASVGPVVNRIPLGEDELVGVDGEPFPVPWPAGADDSAPMDPRVRAEARRSLEELIRGLRALSETLVGAPAAVGRQAAGVRTPTQLVDAVVLTAADGIEDLAAGLMRANELASVAERVTNRATLLALNAALEATRSGSEAFAAIAEETRRLAEFAREATDTISRLANEIEYKVGETIHAIHAASEDAKSSLVALGGAAGASAAAPAPSGARARVAELLERAEAMRRSLGNLAPQSAPGPGAPASGAPASRPPVSETPAEPSSSAGPAPLQAIPPAPSAAESGPAPDALEVAGGFLTIDPTVAEDLVQNGGGAADNQGAKDFLLLEGLEPGSRFAG